MALEKRIRHKLRISKEHSKKPWVSGSREEAAADRLGGLVMCFKQPESVFGEPLGYHTLTPKSRSSAYY